MQIYANLAAVALSRNIDNKRYELRVVRDAAYTPHKAATVLRLEAQLRALEMSQKGQG